jgi:hypothetical protein
MVQSAIRRLVAGGTTPPIDVLDRDAAALTADLVITITSRRAAPPVETVPFALFGQPVSAFAGHQRLATSFAASSPPTRSM